MPLTIAITCVFLEFLGLLFIFSARNLAFTSVIGGPCICMARVSLSFDCNLADGAPPLLERARQKIRRNQDVRLLEKHESDNLHLLFALCKLELSAPTWIGQAG